MDAKASSSRFRSKNVYRRKKRTLIPSNIDQWSKLDNAVIEFILARLFVIDFIRCQLVCKRWDSIIHSPTFQNTSHQVVHRLPWFFMVNTDCYADIVYDVEQSIWCERPFAILRDNEVLVSSNGLMCITTKENNLIVCNPLTGSQRSISENFEINDDIEAITLHASRSSYKVFVVGRRRSQLVVKVYSSEDTTWTTIPLEEELLYPDNQNSMINEDEGLAYEGEGLADEGALGNVVAEIEEEFVDYYTSFKRCGLSTTDSCGNTMVHYIHPVYGLVSCDMQQFTAYTYPLLPNHGETHETPYHLVECRGRILVLVHVEDSEGKCRLRFSGFDDRTKMWRKASTVYPLSAEYSVVDITIQCAGFEDYVMVCVSSNLNGVSEVLMYRYLEDTWTEMPPYFYKGICETFVSSFAIMPDIEAKV